MLPGVPRVYLPTSTKFPVGRFSVAYGSARIGIKTTFSGQAILEPSNLHTAPLPPQKNLAHPIFACIILVTMQWTLLKGERMKINWYLYIAVLGILVGVGIARAPDYWYSRPVEAFVAVAIIAWVICRVIRWFKDTFPRPNGGKEPE